MLRTVVDTNITVSGLLFGGIPLKVIQAALVRKFVWVTSPTLMEETERVMRSDKFGLTHSEIQVLTTPIFDVAEIVIPTHSLDVIKRCPADNRVLECAAEGRCSIIVSGDRRDLLSLKSYHHIEIITARQFLDRI